MSIPHRSLDGLVGAHYAGLLESCIISNRRQVDLSQYEISIKPMKYVLDLTVYASTIVRHVAARRFAVILPSSADVLSSMLRPHGDLRREMTICDQSIRKPWMRDEVGAVKPALGARSWNVSAMGYRPGAYGKQEGGCPKSRPDNTCDLAVGYRKSCTSFGLQKRISLVWQPEPGTQKGGAHDGYGSTSISEGKILLLPGFHERLPFEEWYLIKRAIYTVTPTGRVSTAAHREHLSTLPIIQRVLLLHIRAFGLVLSDLSQQSTRFGWDLCYVVSIGYFQEGLVDVFNVPPRLRYVFCSDKVLRSGSSVAANCADGTSVVSGLGVCLSELVEVTSPALLELVRLDPFKYRRVKDLTRILHTVECTAATVEGDRTQRRFRKLCL
ncbi:hypothetical protein BDZ89DRAFT_1041085 [Hymenopellis radicata]|nr:hypothetical protein BDZ89DRAFT_1041085 [Hymenopellis radicata]